MAFFKVKPREPQARPAVATPDVCIAWRTDPEPAGDHPFVWLQDVARRPQDFRDAPYTYRIHPAKGQTQAEFDELADLFLDLASGKVSADQLCFVVARNKGYSPMVGESGVEFFIVDAVAHEIRMTGYPKFAAKKRVIRFPGQTEKGLAEVLAHVEEASADYQKRNPRPSESQDTRPSQWINRDPNEKVFVA